MNQNIKLNKKSSFCIVENVEVVIMKIDNVCKVIHEKDFQGIPRSILNDLGKILVICYLDNIFMKVIIEVIVHEQELQHIQQRKI